MRGAQSYGRFRPNSEGLAGTPCGIQPLAQRCEASPISRRNCSSDSGFPFPAVARRRAANNRRAFFGDLRRCAVSISPASSSAGTIATLLSPLRRTMTTSWSFATRSSTEARLWRRLVYVVSVTFNLAVQMYRIPVHISIVCFTILWCIQHQLVSNASSLSYASTNTHC
jgi:hypothetical protein